MRHVYEVFLLREKASRQALGHMEWLTVRTDAFYQSIHVARHGYIPAMTSVLSESCQATSGIIRHSGFNQVNVEYYIYVWMVDAV